jgi:hypothetical protein
MASKWYNSFTFKEQRSLEMKLEVKNVKTWTGVEGIGFQASLYADGKRIAVVTDDAWGGEYRYDVLNQDKLDEAREYAKSLPPVPVFNSTVDSCLDIVVDELVNEYEENKQWKRLCKNKIVLITSDCGKGEYRTVNVSPTPAYIKAVKEKYPDAEIVNERF